MNVGVAAFVVSAVSASAVWALSIPVTGHTEPWDAGPLYYPVALAVGGAVAGILVPRHPLAHYIGAIFGQAVYEWVVLEPGPLFLLGLAFLAGYSIVFLAAAAIAGARRKASPGDAKHPGEA